jgi:choline dehydrogenase-like flavoprotein
MPQRGRALQHDAAELQADREFVLEAARQNGTALHYAAGVQQADHGELRQAAANGRSDRRKDGRRAALRYAVPALTADRGPVLKAVRKV